MESDQNPHHAIDFDLQEVISQETWCYAGMLPGLKEKRPGFVFAREMKWAFDSNKNHISRTMVVFAHEMRWAFDSNKTISRELW